MQISRTITLITIITAVLCTSSLAYAASLDVPSNGDTLSGIGIIHGWKCETEGAITIRFDAESSIPATYGFPRGDTSQTCGGDDGNNGFYAFYNWAILGDGEHTAVAYDDGVPFARATFTVVTTGEEFLSGVEAQCTIPDFPAPGEEADVIWNQSTQHLELASVRGSGTPSPLVQSKLYWVGGDKVQRANLDGSQVELLVSQAESNSAGYIAVDTRNGKVYWLARSELLRANLDGSQVELLLPRPNSLHNRSNLAVDPSGRKLYWAISEYSNETGRRREEILRANLDGSQVETVPGSSGAYDLAVDHTGGKLYWVVAHHSRNRDYREEIRRANLDGSQVEILFAIVTGPHRALRDFVVDPAGDKLYWTTGGELWRANLDGSRRELLFSFPGAPDIDARGPNAIAVDPAGGKLYWTTRIRYSSDSTSEVRRTNLDGSQLEILFNTGFGAGNGLAGFALALVHP